MFNPSRQQVREFFCDAWQKHLDHAPTTPLESMAIEIMQMHPEYHDILVSPDSRHADYTVEAGQTNPFLHMSMHLAIAAQLSIDPPRGICAAWNARSPSHDAPGATHYIVATPT